MPDLGEQHDGRGRPPVRPPADARRPRDAADDGHRYELVDGTLVVSDEVVLTAPFRVRLAPEELRDRG